MQSVFMSKFKLLLRKRRKLRGRPLSKIEGLGRKRTLQSRASAHSGPSPYPRVAACAARFPVIRCAGKISNSANGKVSGQTRLLLARLLLTQHSFTLTERLLLRRSASHRSSHSRASNWFEPKPNFRRRPIRQLRRGPGRHCFSRTKS